MHRGLFVHSPETFLHAHHANVRARLTGAPFLFELRVSEVVRALPIPNPRAYLGTAQAHVALDVVAVNGLRNLRQLTPVRAHPSARETLTLTLLRGSDVVRHGVQTVVREALPPWLPREGSARLTAFSAAREPLHPIAFPHHICSPNCRTHVSGNIFCNKRRMKDNREDVRDDFWTARLPNEAPMFQKFKTTTTPLHYWN